MTNEELWRNAMDEWKRITEESKMQGLPCIVPQNTFHSHRFPHAKSLRTKFLMSILLTGIYFANITKLYAFV